MNKIFSLFLIFIFFSCFQKNNFSEKKETRSSINKKEYSLNQFTDSLNLPLGYERITDKQFNSDISAIKYFNNLIDILNFYTKDSLIIKSQGYSENELFYYPIKHNLIKTHLSDKIIRINKVDLILISTKNKTNLNPNRNQENIFLVSLKENSIHESLRIYSNFVGEFGFKDSRFFYIDKDGIINIRDYSQEEGKPQISNIMKYQVTPQGKFIRYYDKDGSFKNEEEQGIVKNHTREGKWVEMKPNYFIDSKNYQDNYTYLEAQCKDGLPIGEWRFYKLEQDYNDNGEPIFSTRKKGELLYTETYKDGELLERKFVK